MKHQFYIVHNPKAPNDPVYVYHAKRPRFFAKVVDDTLELSEMVDIDPERVEGKFRRMQEWFKDYLIKKKQLTI